MLRRFAHACFLAGVLGTFAQCRMPGGGESVAAPAVEGQAVFAPSKSAPRFPAAPSTWMIPLEFAGGPGFVRGGVPFPPGFLRDATALRLDDGSPLDAEPIAHWPDGSVKWLLVEALATGEKATLFPGDGARGPGVDEPKLAPGALTLSIDGEVVDLGAVKWTLDRRTSLACRVRARGRTASGLDWSARLERAAGEPTERLRLELRNPTPTTESKGQPTCMTLGCPGTKPIASLQVKSPRGCRARWGADCGASPIAGGVSLLPEPMELRPGEQYGWEIVVGDGPDEARLLEFPAAWGCSSKALGPLVPLRYDLFGDYESNSIAGAQGMRAGRARPHWRNPRDFGEDQRDWDGGVVDTDFQTHNNEYEAHFAYAKQRVRTMGLHGASRDWHYLGLTGTRHFANVDIYHVHEGPLPFMHGAAFQHVRHGGAGHGDQHRSSFAPNMAHQTGRGLLAWFYLTGDPLLLDSFFEVAENTRWRVMNGPGMPGISGTEGEERGPAMALGILTDAWAHTGDEKWLAAAKKVVDECHAKRKPYTASMTGAGGAAAGGGSWRCKPWMITLLVVTLDEFQDQLALAGRTVDAMAAKESAGLYKTFLSRSVKTGPDMIHLPYQVSSDPEQVVDESRDSWSVVAADALADFYPDTAFALFRAGSRVIWHAKHPVGSYAKLLNHIVLSGWGHRAMAAMAANADGTGAGAPAAAPAAGGAGRGAEGAASTKEAPTSAGASSPR